MTSIVSGTGFTLSSILTQVVMASSMSQSVEKALRMLLDSNGELRPLTPYALDLVEEAQDTDSPDAHILQGLIEFSRDGGFNHFREAELSGSTHPVLHHLLGECYRLGSAAGVKDVIKAVEYYEKAIQGGCTWPYRALSTLRHNLIGAAAHKTKTLRYLEDLETLGHTDGRIIAEIGDMYRHGTGCKRDSEKAQEYFKQAMNHGDGCATAYVFQVDLWRDSATSAPDFSNKALSLLLDAHQRGIGGKDEDCLLSEVLTIISNPSYKPDPSVLDGFEDKVEAFKHYVTILKDRKSPRAHVLENEFYKYKTEYDKGILLSIWIEAEILKLATCPIYNYLADAYKTGFAQVPKDGEKSLEYYEKALQVATLKVDMAVTYSNMAEVYMKGIPPIQRDVTQGKEYTNKARAMMAVKKPKK